MGLINDMKLFVWTVEEGSFSGASRKAQISPAMVGRRIAKLEEKLGFTLLNRTTRRMQVTSGGETYYEGCLHIIRQIEELEESLSSVHSGIPRGLVRISAPDGVGIQLTNAISRFREHYPEVRFHLGLTNKPIDLIATKTDLAIRLSFDLQDSDLVAWKIKETTFGLYASKTYLEERGIPSDLKELDTHDCISMGVSRYQGSWQFIQNGKVVSFQQPWAFVSSKTDCILHAVASGLGIAMIPEMFVETYPGSDQLQRIDDFVQFPKVGVYIYYPTRRHLTYRTSLFIDFLKEGGLFA